ncbi:MAG: MerR family transcriptional regulator [Anaerolineales bacterium]
MFKIREFARFTRVSVKMLRHYDELGLLRPARVDPATGYRYYSANQMPRLNRLIALKDLGFSLEQIADFLNADLSPDEIRGMLKLRRAEIKQQLQRERERLAQVEAHLRQLDQPAQLPQYAVVLREVPPQWVASIRQTIDDEDAITRLFEELEDYLAQHRARAAYSPLTIYHDAAANDEAQEAEAAVPVNRPLPSTSRITVYELPRLPLAACVVYEGNYARGAEALHTLSAWIEHNGYAIAGPMREVYLRFGANDPDKLRLPVAFLTEDNRQYVTEIQLPVEKH